MTLKLLILSSQTKILYMGKRYKYNIINKKLSFTYKIFFMIIMELNESLY